MCLLSRQPVPYQFTHPSNCHSYSDWLTKVFKFTQLYLHPFALFAPPTAVYGPLISCIPSNFISSLSSVFLNWFFPTIFHISFTDPSSFFHYLFLFSHTRYVTPPSSAPIQSTLYSPLPTVAPLSMSHPPNLRSPPQLFPCHLAHWSHFHVADFWFQIHPILLFFFYFSVFLFFFFVVCFWFFISFNSFFFPPYLQTICHHASSKTVP